MTQAKKICPASATFVGLTVLIVFLFASREARAVPPLAPNLFEDYMGCPSPSLAAASLAPLTCRVFRNRSHTLVRSASLSAARRKVRALHALPRIQIVNGMLHANCPGLSGCQSVGHELRTLQLLMRASRVGDVDFFFDGGERPCYIGRRRRGHERAMGHAVGINVPVVTHETDVSGQGCDANILAPPRALDALPDGGRWLARAEADESRWARTRRNVVVWRGAATDRGRLFNKDGTSSAVRAKAVELSSRRAELLDARFSGRNDDLQLREEDRARVRARGWGADGSGFLTWRQLLRFRATLVLDGNTVPDRLPFLMFSQLAILKQESSLREAWYDQLVPYVHYIPVRADLSDLEAQIEWALNDTTRLHSIATNGARLAMRWLSRRAQLCHWSSMLRELSKLTAKPIVLEPPARRVDEAGHMLLGGAVLHNPFSSALRPMLTGRPPQLDDFEAVRYLKLGPCVEMTSSHLCLDV